MNQVDVSGRNMKHFFFTVFAKSESLFLLHVADSEGRLIGQRELRTEEVHSFAQEIDKTYHLYSSELAHLGQRLYDWLDGANERWLTTLL